MNDLPFSPHRGDDLPPPRSVPVTAVVLAFNEAMNIERCITSLSWCNQVVVVDSGSTDGTARVALGSNAEVVSQPWLGYGGQRQWALRSSYVRNDWVYFVDADEWVSSGLAVEVATAIEDGRHDAYEHRLRLVFLGRWIAHCGWYPGSWVVRIGRRDAMSFDAAAQIGERAVVRGTVGRLTKDIVDEDLKGLRAWLHKHVDYAALEAQRRSALAVKTGKQRGGHRTRTRALLKDVVYPRVPFRPIALFAYMYVLRQGYRDGRQGLVFCALHAWHEFVVGQLAREAKGQPPTGDPTGRIDS